MYFTVCKMFFVGEIDLAFSRTTNRFSLLG